VQVFSALKKIGVNEAQEKVMSWLRVKTL